MINYEVYLRNEDGKRGSLVNGIISLTATFRFNQPVKWVMTGAGLEECSVDDSAEIAVFRNGVVLFCGYVNQKKTVFDAKTRIYDWELSGYSDLGKIAWRLVNPNPYVVPPDPNETYSASGVLSTVLLDTIDLNAGASAVSGSGYSRKLPNLIISEQLPVGDTESIESKLESLLKLVQDNLEATEIQIKEVWDMATGTWDIRIGNPEDVSDKVIFSVDNGSISSWERTVTAPKANYLIVTGGQGENGETMYIRVSDQDSIDKWGRIENIVSRTDIKRNEEIEESWESVAARLESAAYEELEKASAQYGYKLTTTEINRNVYLEDYDIGSIVAVRVGSDEFTAKVEEIKITYAEGIETIVPSVGTMQKGELQSVFTELGTLKEAIKVLQKS